MRASAWACWISALSLCVACRGLQPRLEHQAKYKVYAPSSFFKDGLSMRPPVAGTVAREDRPVARPSLSLALLKRGRLMFNVNCAVCHSVVGDGDGIVPQRGFIRPPSYHNDRLRQASDEHFFEVITKGYGAMFPFGDRVAAPDRWAIVAYIRSLQLSRNVNLKRLSANESAQIREHMPHE